MSEFARHTISNALGSLDSLVHRQSLATILCYHRIDEHDAWDYSLGIEAFKAQLAYLAGHFQFIGLADIEAFLDQKLIITQPSVALTFDDGYAGLSQVTDICQTYGVSPTVFLIADQCPTDSAGKPNNPAHLSAAELGDLKSSGWTFGSHTASHAILDQMSPSLYPYEIQAAKQRIEDATSLDCRWIAYPYGHYNQQVLEVVRQSGYRLGLSGDRKPLTSQADRFSLPRVTVTRGTALEDILLRHSPTNLRLRQILKGK